jgi:hypothetical protein
MPKGLRKDIECRQPHSGCGCVPKVVSERVWRRILGRSHFTESCPACIDNCDVSRGWRKASARQETRRFEAFLPAVSNFGKYPLPGE